MYFARQQYPVSSLLWLLTLELLIRKLATLKGIPRELGCGSSKSTYAVDVIVIVSSHRHIDLVSETLKEYEAMKVEKINSEMSVDLRLGTWGNKPIPSNSISIVGHWTDRPVKLVGV